VKVRRSLLKSTVSVESYAGEGAYGPTYADPVAVPCHKDTTRRLVLNANGVEVVSELTLYVHPDDAAAFLAESRIDSSSRVISASEATFRGTTALVTVACS
jgi:hypothetical protein